MSKRNEHEEDEIIEDSILHLLTAKAGMAKQKSKQAQEEIKSTDKKGTARSSSNEVQKNKRETVCVQLAEYTSSQ